MNKKILLAAFVIFSCSGCITFSNPAPVVTACEAYKDLKPSEMSAIADAIDLLDRQIALESKNGTPSPYAPLSEPLLEWWKHRKGAQACSKIKEKSI